MSFTYKNNISISIFGTSHGSTMGISLDGIRPGFVIDIEQIKEDIIRRKPISGVSTSRVEADEFEIVNGVFNGFTTGDVIQVLIKNENTISKHYQSEIMRPSHSDYASYVKSGGFHDYRGGGKFSGRLTVLFVIIGSIAKQVLKQDFNIDIYSNVNNIGNVFDDEFNDINGIDKLKSISKETAPFFSEEKKQLAFDLANQARLDLNSVGGSINVYANNLDVGVGSLYFDSFESVFAHLMFSIPAVKGVSFGLGEKFATSFGSDVNDQMRYDENLDVVFLSNNNGGVTGGMTNGALVKANVVFKPTPSIYKEQQTIDVENKQNVKHAINGRHDPCIVFRCGVICESIMALTILDLI